MLINRVANIGLTLAFAGMATILTLLGDEILGPDWYRFFYHHRMSAFFLVVLLYAGVIASWLMTGWRVVVTLKEWNKPS